MPLNMEIWQLYATLRRSSRTLWKVLSETSKRDTKSNFKKQRKKIFSNPSQLKSTAQRQDDRYYWENSIRWFKVYVKGLSNRGAVITWTIANAAAKALIRKYPGVVGDTDVDSSFWAQSLFRRMGFSRRRKTSTKVDIPISARKEIEYLFLHEIVSKVEKYSIPDSLIINFDQTDALENNSICKQYPCKEKQHQCHHRRSFR